MRAILNETCPTNCINTRYEVMRKCREARAPYTTEADLLRRAFQVVDPRRTEMVSIPQFLQAR